MCIVYIPPDVIVSEETWLRILDIFDGLYITAGDMNAHHPTWVRSQENRNDNKIANLLVNANVSLMYKPQLTRLSSPVQRYSAVDLTMASPVCWRGSLRKSLTTR
ncbi:Endonuclease-reverse transcriptase [Popillia japonica]|uniref:Endonuclease-reverse transcriptase n=1 Tax=Popillia japonica TaxID=7064 RepID=A0AAW1JX91_POPJA